jgi:uncharacterized protein
VSASEPRAFFSRLSLAVLPWCLAATSCVSARVLDEEADRLFRDRQFVQAAGHLESEYKKRAESAKASGGDFEDELLYLLDWALSLHTAGNYEASNAIFVLAEKQVWGNDYTSIGEEAGTLLTGENTKVYRGEDFEKVLIHVYKALNFALLGKGEESLVEARLVDRKLQALHRDGEKPYKQNAFARYLSGILYESEREWNDAYVDYKKTRELVPEFIALGEDLIRVARRLGMRDQVERWEREYGLASEKGRPRDRTEIIVIYQNGWAPRKEPREDFPSLPRFRPYPDAVRGAEVVVDGQARGSTSMLHDIEATAIENLDERVAGMVAKRIAGRVLKEVAAAELERRTNNAAVGALARVILIASDQADLRSWLFLPRDLQILRIPVEPGTHEVEVFPAGRGALSPQKVDVRGGEKKLVNFRYIPSH